MDKAIDTTAKALASLSHHVGSNKDQGPSKGFQNLIKMIGEAKTKHVSSCVKSRIYSCLLSHVVM